MKTLLLIALLALAIALPANGATQATTLTGTVGPGFTITLKKAGVKVKTLKRGTYKFVVSDKSSIHNFHLKGPKGYSKQLTTVAYTGTKTYTITLTPGVWRYVCDPHSTTMKGSFTVTS
jgi:plastocyanin